MLPSATKDDTTHNLKNAAQAIKNDVRGAVEETKDDLCAAANKAGHKVRNFIDSTSEELSHATQTVTEHVHNKPMQSSLIALGIGFVLGALFRR